MARKFVCCPPRTPISVPKIHSRGPLHEPAVSLRYLGIGRETRFESSQTEGYVKFFWGILKCAEKGGSSWTGVRKVPPIKQLIRRRPGMMLSWRPATCSKALKAEAASTCALCNRITLICSSLTVCARPCQGLRASDKRAGVGPACSSTGRFAHHHTA